MLAGDWSARSGYELGLKLARERDVTAVFAGNDQMALGVVRALHELGLRIPADISVVGFDDTVLPDLGHPTKAELEKAMEGNVVANAEVVGTYQKKNR